MISASINPSWCRLLLVYYIATDGFHFTSDGFHYTSPSAKPSTTGIVQVVCASGQWDAYLTTYSERKFTRDYVWMGNWGKSSVEVQGTGHSAHQSLSTACKELLVLRGVQLSSFHFHHHNFQILPQQCLLSELILKVA